MLGLVSSRRPAPDLTRETAAPLLMMRTSVPSVRMSPARSVRTTSSDVPMTGISAAVPPVATVIAAALLPALRRPLTWRMLPSAKARPLAEPKRRTPTVEESWAVIAPATLSREAEVVVPSVGAVATSVRAAAVTWAVPLMAA